VKIDAIDAFFIVLPGNPQELNESNVDIVIGDLDNVRIRNE
jgi:hypothetical protein